MAATIKRRFERYCFRVELEAVYFGLRFSFDGKVEGRGEAWTLRFLSRLRGSFFEWITFDTEIKISRVWRL